MSFLTDETLFAGTISDSDLIHLVDVSNTTQNAAGSSFKLTIGQLKAYMPTIYSADGTLSGARVVTQGGNALSFVGGNVGIGITPSDTDTRLHIQGVDSTSGNYALKIKNSASAPILYARNDKTITLLTDSYAVMGGLEAYYPPEFKVGATRNIWWSSGSSESSLFIENGTIQAFISQLKTNGLHTGTITSHDYILRSNNSERVFIDKGGQVVIGGFGASSVTNFNNAQLIINTGLTNSLNVNGNILLRSIYAPVSGNLFSSPRVVFSSYYNNGGGSTEFKADIRYVAETTAPTGRLAFSIGGTEFMKIKTSGVVNMGSLPTSSAGLVSGDLWNNSGVINIV